MQDLCDWLLRTPTSLTTAVDDVPMWWRRHCAVTAIFPSTLARAAVGGFAADRIGYAFASGYSEALRALLHEGDPSVAVPTALCATEEGGAHPRAIATRLLPIASPGSQGSQNPTGNGWLLRGHKRFVTLGTHATRLLIVASHGTDEAGRNRLAVVCIPAERAGVQLHPMPPTPFVPEIPHCTVSLSDVAITAHEILPGDGYDRYLKPFRTVEDIHVHAALLGHAIGAARRWHFPTPVMDEALALLCALSPLSAADPRSAAAHIALGGVLSATARWVDSLSPLWSRLPTDTPERQRWERDRALLYVAGKARAARLASAWATYHTGTPARVD